jgi:hypothetical protein
MAAKFFTGLPLDGPDPECVQGFGESALAESALSGTSAVPKSAVDHSRTAIRRAPARASVPLTLITRPPSRACNENPLTGLELDKR